VRECRRLARTIRAWEAEVLAFHTTGRSDGPTEGINLLIKKVKRVGHGFRNFNNYRLRLLLHCGVTWHTVPTARVRGNHASSRRAPMQAMKVRNDDLAWAASHCLYVELVGELQLTSISV
jgi:hypothetical protein